MGGGGWSWVEVEMSWVEMDGGGWRWLEVGAWFSNTRKIYLSVKDPFESKYRLLINGRVKVGSEK